MYVSPQAAVQQVVAAVSNAANMQTVTTTAGHPTPQNNVAAAHAAAAATVRFNMGQQLYHFAAAAPASLQLTPLLQAPPQMQHPAAIAAAASLGVQVNPAVSAAAAFGLQQAAAAHVLHHNLQHPPPQTPQEVSPTVAQPPNAQQNLHHGPTQHYLMSAYRYIHMIKLHRFLFYFSVHSIMPLYEFLDRVVFTLITFCIICKDTIFSVISILDFLKSISRQIFTKTKRLKGSKTIVFDFNILFVFINV